MKMIKNNVALLIDCASANSEAKMASVVISINYIIIDKLYSKQFFKLHI